MAKIRWTSEAEKWLRDIHDYIALNSPSAAIKVVKSIYDKVQTLKNLPEIGYRYRTEIEGDIKDFTLRSLSYCVFNQEG